MSAAFTFLAPWILTALVLLPAIWWLLRVTPPRPRQVLFPPTRLLRDIVDRETTPRRMPLWLLLLRLALVTAVILALAEPVFRPSERLTAAGDRSPLLILLDNGWDAAPDWQRRVDHVTAAIHEAERDARPVALAATADGPDQNIAPSTADEARRRLAAMAPQAWLPRRGQLAARIAEAYADNPAEILFVAGTLAGIDDDEFLAALQGASDLATLVRGDETMLALRPPRNGVEGVSITAESFGDAPTATVAAFDEEGRRLASAPLTFEAGSAETVLALPSDLRNDMARIALTGTDSAGAVQLLDVRFRRRAVGLVAAGDVDAQPLLTPLTYVSRALANGADVITGREASAAESIEGLIDRGVSVLVLSDVGTLPDETVTKVQEWIENGGTLLRFANPRLTAGDDVLLPVVLRGGERQLGGALSWEEPRPISTFSPDSPFAAIPVPGDVRITRQLLADPLRLGEAEIWAELDDGTPLVTAARRGQGRIVLFHVTADPRWSNLPLSGAFVQMMIGIVETAQAVTPSETEARTGAGLWRAEKVLDGFGKLGPPSKAALVAEIEAATASRETPPGLYKREGVTYAINAVSEGDVLSAFEAEEWSGRTAGLLASSQRAFGPWLLALAAVLAIVDAIAMLLTHGRRPRLGLPGIPARGAAALVLTLLALAVPTGRADAQTDPDFGLEAALETRLAYVMTGDAVIDETSRAGLLGLSRSLAGRTALEPGPPIGVDPGTDELAFFSLIYWPVDSGAPEPDAETIRRIDAFLRNGGTILFDTRDAGALDLTGFGTPENAALRRILDTIDVPPLEPVPEAHVLTKAFYLLRTFPGRYREGPLWVEALPGDDELTDRPARGGDGVSPIIITGNDFASAWAIDAEGSFLFPTVPPDPRQRELAYRAGINIVMYTLTGNYKADQVHVPALLERLGQ